MLKEVTYERIFALQMEMEPDDPTAVPALPPHPLNNGLVLGVIFDHLPKTDWKSARLVNKTWHYALQLRWRDQMVNLLGYGIEDPEVEPTVTTKFLKEQHPENNPNDPLQLSRFPIRNISVRSDGNQHYILLQPDESRFWELFGHKLTRIDLDHIRIHRGASLKRLLFELTPSLEGFRYYHCVCDDMNELELNTVTEYTPPATQQSNLNFLEINVAHDLEGDSVSNDYKPRFPINWIDFFSMFTNIQKFSPQIDPAGSQRPSDLLKLLEAIDIIRRANNYEVFNFDELTFDDQTHVDVIRNHSLFVSYPISTLRLDIADLSRDDVIPFIQGFQSTLRKLHLFTPFRYHAELQFLPCDTLPRNLTELYVEGPVFSSLAFLVYIPNLEKLALVDVHDPDVHPAILHTTVRLELEAAIPLVKLKNLTYRNSTFSEPVTTGVLGIFVELMPKVKTCMTFVNLSGFRLICSRWSNLEVLILRGQLHLYKEDRLVEYLVQLKCLKTFAGNYDPCTNKSVFEGFLKVPSLTRIYLSRLAEIFEDGFEALKRNNCVLTLHEKFPSDLNHLLLLRGDLTSTLTC